MADGGRRKHPVENIPNLAASTSTIKSIMYEIS